MCRRLSLLAGVVPGRVVARVAAVVLLAGVAVGGAGCGSSQALHPPPPPTGGLGPIADPPPSLVVVHATVFADGLQRQLDGALPREGTGEVAVVAGQTLRYRWDRKPLALAFDRGRVVITVDVTGHVNLLGDRAFPIRLTVAGEPVLSADYQARLQSLTVEAHADAPVAARTIEEALRKAVGEQLDAFRLDLRPTIAAAYDRLSRPLPLPLGDGGASACALLRVAGVQAGPTVLAGGFEKDLALTVLPSVVMPCPAASTAPPPPLPLLANVATLASGPFTVTVPIAASYDELSAAIDKAMGGRLSFSKDYPDLYLEKPQVFPSRDTLVIRILLGGTVQLAGRMKLSGELYFSGHPRVIDNQITIPDLELTPGTASGLLQLKVLLDGKAIRDQAQAALRVDLSERIAAARGKLSTELSFALADPPPTPAAPPGPGTAAPSTAAPSATSTAAPSATSTAAPAASSTTAPAPPSGPVEAGGCLRAEALRTEVTGIFPHESFLRVYVLVSAQAALYLPCRR